MADQLTARVTLVQQVDDREIRAELARQRKSQADLAEALGISQQSLSNRLTGDTAFAMDELAKVAELLGVDVEQFLNGAAA